jgi:hypothetical protein
MAEKILKTIVALRRGSEADYDHIPDYIPKNGEVGFVNFPDNKVRYKVGDGTTKFSDLPYADQYLIDTIENLIARGYYDAENEEFYQDAEKTIKYVPYEYKIYIDIPTWTIYSYSESDEKYHTTGGVIPQATDLIPGIMKLYNNTGENVDGTMTQKSITGEIKKKFEVSVEEPEELLFLSN